MTKTSFAVYLLAMWRTVHAEMLLRRGQHAIQAGRLDQARDALERALAVRADFAPAILYKAVALGERGDHGEALAWAGRAVALVPRRAAYRLIQGRLAYDAGNDEAAAQSFEEAIRLSPDNRLAAAYRLLVRIRRSLPGPEAADLDALDRLLVNTNPSFQARWLILCEDGLAAFAPHGRSLALQMIGATYLDSPPDVPSTFYQRWWRELKAFGEQLNNFSAARRETQVLRQEIGVRLKAGDGQGALDCLEGAIEHLGREGDLSDLYLDLCLYQGRYGSILEDLGSETDIRGLEDLAARRNEPGMGRKVDAEIQRLTILGLVRFHQGRWQGAVRLFEAVAAADPRDYIAPYFLGAAHLAAHRPRPAREWFARAVAVVNPGISGLRLQEWRRCLALQPWA